MIRKKKGNIEWLEFELLTEEPGIAHGVFLRNGGVSQETFGSLNVSNGIGDTEENVSENRRRILEILGIERLVLGLQVQGVHIEHAVGDFERYLDCDGLITSKKDLGLLIMHADCQAVILYDPVHQVVANIHVGWRGQFKNIYKKTIDEMSQVYGTKPEDLLVCISPSLGPQNAEFINYKTEVPEEFWEKFQVNPTYFDLWALARHQLEECGVLPQHIEIAQIDTYANSSDYFSFRRETKLGRKQNRTGNHGTVVALKGIK
jgi:polyphenol oxidase